MAIIVGTSKGNVLSWIAVLNQHAGGSQSASIALIEGFALGCDSQHITGPHPDGVTLRRLLREVGQDRPVDLVHAHGTGTEANDAIELAAIDAIVRGEPPAVVYSHKA